MISCSVVGLVIALTAQISTYVTRLQRVGVEYEAVVNYFRQAETTLSDLRREFERKSFPAEMVERYTRELRRCANDLDNFDAILHEITQNLSRPFFSRLWQKSSLAHGDMTLLDRRLNFFNQNLSHLLARLTLEVVAMIHENVADVQVMSAEVNRAIRIDMSARYGPTALRVIQGDGWSDGDGDAGVAIQPGRWNGASYRTDAGPTTPDQAAAAAYAVELPAGPMSPEPEQWAPPPRPPPPRPPPSPTPSFAYHRRPQQTPLQQPYCPPAPAPAYSQHRQPHHQSVPTFQQQQQQQGGIYRYESVSGFGYRLGPQESRQQANDTRMYTMRSLLEDN